MAKVIVTARVRVLLGLMLRLHIDLGLWLGLGLLFKVRGAITVCFLCLHTQPIRSGIIFRTLETDTSSH